uniref:Rubrerythrin diiron-binding domain-containing protein n=1 Tax=Desulfatirhabdium butyrativorans TaxID=340467 RepID=A0A7C4RU37_9BACT
MSTKSFQQVFQLLIDLELKVGRLYQKFAERFAEDGRFWSTLHQEEIEHAKILNELKTCMENGAEQEHFCSKISTETLGALISSIETILQDETYPATRKEALWIAMQTELSAGEFHMKMIQNGLFKNSGKDPFLWRADFDHAERIRAYLSA